MYTLYMSINSVEYALFSYQPLRKDNIPPLAQWKTTERVCYLRNDGTYALDYEFREWIAAMYFPYASYVDHTNHLVFGGDKKEIFADYLQFKLTL